MGCYLLSFLQSSNFSDMECVHGLATKSSYHNNTHNRYILKFFKRFHFIHLAKSYSISEPGKKVQEIEFPAVTICNQGWIDKVIAMSMLSQYRGYVAKQGIAGSETLQFGQKLNLEQKWIKESYPGLNSKPQEIAKLMASPDIEKARKY